jgi:hypothetical protein
MDRIDLDLSKATMCSKQGGRTAVDGWVILYNDSPIPGGVSVVTKSGHDVVRCSQWPDCSDCKANHTRVLTEDI